MSKNIGNYLIGISLPFSRAVPVKMELPSRSRRLGRWAEQSHAPEPAGSNDNWIRGSFFESESDVNPFTVAVFFGVTKRFGWDRFGGVWDVGEGAGAVS